MGTSSSKKDVVVTKNTKYDTTPAPSGSLQIVLFRLIWEMRPKILIFKQIGQTAVNKVNHPSLEQILEESTNEDFRTYGVLSKSGSNPLLYYIHLGDGVLITKKLNKLKFLLEKNLDQMVRISLVNISEIMKKFSDYCSIYEIKKVSKYYYDLSKCKIDLSKRNELVEKGKSEVISDEEINLNDEGLNSKSDELIIETSCSESVNKTIENYLYKDVNKPFERFIKYPIENKNKEKENEINENLEDEKRENEEEEEEDKRFESDENEEENEYEEAEDDEEKKKEEEKKEEEKKEEEMGKIKVFLNKGIPFDQREQNNSIKKVGLKFTDFIQNIESNFYLKEALIMLTPYKSLQKFSFYLSQMKEPNKFKGWKYLQKLFLDNFSIRWVSFRNSSLTDNALRIILDGLCIRRVRYLDLSHNKLTDSGMYILCKFLIKNQTLQRLYINRNPYITCDGIKAVVSALKDHPNIHTLNLSNLSIKGCGKQLKILLSNKRVHNLFLKNCSLDFTDFQDLADELSKEDCSIVFLDIGNNKIQDNPHYTEIEKFILKNKSIRKLCLDGLGLNMTNYMPIFKAIFKNRTIQCYSLNQNADLPVKGILNFFMKINYIKELSVIPWDPSVDKTRTFTDDEVRWIKRFHDKCPDIRLHSYELIKRQEKIDQ